MPKKSRNKRWWPIPVIRKPGEVFTIGGRRYGMDEKGTIHRVIEG